MNLIEIISKLEKEWSSEGLMPESKRRIILGLQYHDKYVKTLEYKVTKLEQAIVNRFIADNQS